VQSAALVCGLLFTSPSAAHRLKLREPTQLDVQAVSRTESYILLHKVQGQLRRRERAPIGNAAVVVSARDSSKLPPLMLCGSFPRPVSLPSAQLTTDSDGRFCFEYAGALERLDLRYGGAEFFEGSAHEVTALDIAKVSVSLTPSLSSIDLSGANVALQLYASKESEGAIDAVTAWKFRVKVGETMVFEGSTDDHGVALVPLAPARLGPAGHTTLEVLSLVDGREQVVFTQPLAKTASVKLAVLEGAPDHAPKSGKIAVRATIGDAPTQAGVIELRVDGQVMASQSLDGNGVARLALRGADARSETVRAELLFRPSVTYLSAAEGVALDVVPQRSYRAWALVGLAAVLAAVWAISRRRGTDSARALAPVEEVAFDGSASMQWIRPDLGRAPQKAGLFGRVCDAHDKSAVASVRLRVVRVALPQAVVLAETVSGSDGNFAFEGLSLGPGDRLEALSPLHRTLTQPILGTQTVVRLATRKRALLDDWVRLFGRMVRTRSSGKDVTPKQVRDQAPGNAELRELSLAVERASFGEGPVTEEQEQALQARVEQAANRS
jgi:hypothetical protein